MILESNQLCSYQNLQENGYHLGPVTCVLDCMPMVQTQLLCVVWCVVMQLDKQLPDHKISGIGSYLTKGEN